MVAASVWSLIIPAIEQMAENGGPSWLAPSVGIAFGFLLIFFIQITANSIDRKKSQQKTALGIEKRSLVVFSITLHNVPEGMAVGVALAGAYFGTSLLSLPAALMLALGIAIQNVPEGAIVSIPKHISGVPKFKAFMLGVYSGLVEPIAAVITFFITGFVSQILPFVLAFAAGSMLFVVVEEIIPEAQEGSKNGLASLGFMFGFILMLILDVTLG